jgi:hypothetical protein
LRLDLVVVGRGDGDGRDVAVAVPFRRPEGGDDREPADDRRADVHEDQVERLLPLEGRPGREPVGDEQRVVPAIGEEAPDETPGSDVALGDEDSGWAPVHDSIIVTR